MVCLLSWVVLSSSVVYLSHTVWSALYLAIGSHSHIQSITPKLHLRIVIWWSYSLTDSFECFSSTHTFVFIKTKISIQKCIYPFFPSNIFLSLQRISSDTKWNNFFYIYFIHFMAFQCWTREREKITKGIIANSRARRKKTYTRLHAIQIDGF